MTRRSSLRVYYGPHDSKSVPLNQVVGNEPKVEVALADLVEVLRDAVAQDRTWLNDFENEQVTISTDLYEIIAACRQLKRPA